MVIFKPTIILIRPQLPENIGMVARAMHNFGLENLILVNPRNGWPNDKALEASANSKKIILKTKIYSSLEIALSNFNFVVATSNRKRLLNKPYLNNNFELFNQFPESKKIAILFGPENSGLSNEDLILADIIFNINTDKLNTSLNLSHAVLLISYSWREYFILNKYKSLKNSKSNNIAKKIDFMNFMNFLKSELNETGFLYPKHKSKSMFENIQAMFVRASLSKVEIKTLWGMIKKLRKSR